MKANVILPAMACAALLGAKAKADLLQNVPRQQWSYWMTGKNQAGGQFSWPVIYDIEFVSHELRVYTSIHCIPTPGVTEQEIDDLEPLWEHGIESVWNDRYRILHDSQHYYDIIYDVIFADPSDHYNVEVRPGPETSTMLGWDTYDTGQVAAHEYGHMVGNYDEYGTGAMDPVNPIIDNTSIMGSTSAVAVPYARHYEPVVDWLESKYPSEALQVVPLPEPLFGDLDLNGEVNGLDVEPFVDLLLNGLNQSEADMNDDGVIDGRDVTPFVDVLRTGTGVQTVAEPATVCLVAIGLLGLVVYGWRRGKEVRTMKRHFDHVTSGGWVAVVVAWAVLVSALPGSRTAMGGEVEQRGTLVLDRVPKAKLNLGGLVGTRVMRNVDQWIVQAPKNNPGLLDMFARRDTGGKPDLVPWAGEFVGKYLIAGVQAMRMSDDAELRQTLAAVVGRLVELQAEDGYLGPWPKKERLRGHWDLWGHYHVMLGLMLWHEHTGDERAAVVARRMADLICDTCLDTGFRVVDAGSHEMNMSVIHGMARIYRKTGNTRYLRMTQEILREFKEAGDYYRTGLAGKEFYRTPRPRWESLHALQGLVELYRVTGDETFRTAFLHHWASMRRFDYRNTGGFSSGERATGNPYKDDAIETCCVVAFEEVMIDALRLTGFSTIADDLERTTLNAMLGAQHPSGAWCTYNTPMAGQRIASHIHIRFQAREDTPYLNCCSVNGPRGYGSISQWGVMRSDKGLDLNYYGPMTAEVSLADGTPVAISQETDYPHGGTIRVRIDVPQPKQFTLGLRIPAWSAKTKVSLSGRVVRHVLPGTYLALDRKWNAGDQILVELDMRVRGEPGDLDQFGKVSLYRGPILLARDDRFETRAELKVDITNLSAAKLVALDERTAEAAGPYKPWLVVDVPSVDGKMLRLIDFANAGATTVEGKPTSAYVTWLPAVGIRPPAPVTWQPADRAKVGLGPIRFVWRRPALPATSRLHTVVIADGPDFDHVVLRGDGKSGGWMLVPQEEAKKLKPHTPYYWMVIAGNNYGQTKSMPPFKQFTVDPAAPSLLGDWPYGQREPDQMVTEAPLRGDVEPVHGELLEAKGWQPAPGPNGTPNGAIELDGQGGIVKYKLLTFPERDFTVSIWLSVTKMPTSNNGQVFSAWAAGMDDPLRLVVHGGKLHARIEAGAGYGTQGFPLKTDTWYHVAGVKQGAKLSLYVDGHLQSTANVPAEVVSSAADFAIGGNPNFRGPEFVAVKLADLKFCARALAHNEVIRWGRSMCRQR